MTASRIRDLIHELDLHIKREAVVINRLQGDLDPGISEDLKRQNLTLAGVIPMDEEIYQYDVEGRPTFQLPVESKAVQAALKIFREYIQ